MPEIRFKSEWLKAEDNIFHGENIVFMNTGEQNEKGEWVFMVETPKGEKKKFSLNKRNFEAIRKIYGSNSDKWVGKEMAVRIIDVENPKTGELVRAVRLIAPGSVEAGIEEAE